MRASSKFNESSSDSSLDRSELSQGLEDLQYEKSLSEELNHIRFQSPPQKIRWDSKLKKSLSKKKRAPKASVPKKQKVNLRRIIDIDQAEIEYQKVQETGKKFHWPFEPQQLNAQRKELSKALAQAKDRDDLKAAKLIGVKKEKILYKWKVRENLDEAIKYLETGQLPEYLKVQFESLLNGTPSFYNAGSHH